MSRWNGWVIGLFISVQVFAQQPLIHPSELVIKLKKADDLPSLSKSIPVDQFSPIAKPVFQQTESTQKPSVLDNIYKITVLPGTDIRTLCDSLNKLGHVVYAEPIYLESPLFIPNDPAAQPGSQQNYLEIIKAYEAWEITKSNPNIIIGIIDTGMQLDHEDLQSQLHENNDPINGIDDDGNGYIDDQFGYDFADRDHDATADFNQHGTHVTGIAGAATNNGIGMAGVGYHARISPLKIFRSDNGASANSYEAIIYAADNGYDIATLSWGSINTFSQFNQDVINYAVLEKNLILVGAAGNTGTEVKFFPASYDHVLSVGATNNSDTKAGFSTFNDRVDLVAPGQAIYSTQNNNTYNTDNGTSHAVPMVAGVAALVKDKFPHLNALQVMERIRVTTDNIYAINDNQSFEGKLGRGRLNAYRAVTVSNLVSMRLISEESDLKKPYFGDTVTFNLTFTNYLDPVIETTIEFEPISPFLSFNQLIHTFGYIPSMTDVHIKGLMAFIDQHAPADTVLNYRIIIKAGTYTETYSRSITTSPDFVTLANEPVGFSIAGNGNLGYLSDPFTNGVGLRWNGVSVLDQVGIALATSATAVADNFTSDWQVFTREQDFKSQQPIRQYQYLNDIHYASNSFQPKSGQALPDVLCLQESFMWDDLPGVVLKYEWINTSTDTIEQAVFGLLANWDLADGGKNKSWFDGQATSYAADSAMNQQAAVRLVSTGQITHHSLNYADFSSNNLILSDSAKWELMTTASPDSLGFIDPLNVVNITSTRIENWLPKSSKTVYTLMAVGVGKDTIDFVLNELENRLEILRNNPYNSDIIISCENAIVKVAPSKGENFIFFSDPQGTDTLGVGNDLDFGPILGDTAIYYAELVDGYTLGIRSVQIRTTGDIGSFSLSIDTLFQGDQPINRVFFTDLTPNAIDWLWDFGNGQQATGIQNPSSLYQESGIYTITLSVTTTEGCTSMVSQSLIVAERPTEPEIEDMGVCPDTDIKLFTTGGDLLRMYVNETNPGIVAAGDTLQLGRVRQDTVLYVSRLVGEIESRRKRVAIQVFSIDSSYSVLPVLDSLSGNFGRLTLNHPYPDSVLWYLDGAMISDSSMAIFPVTKSDYLLELYFKTASGCSIFKEDSLVFTAAPEPTIDIPIICLGDTLQLIPGNGKFFGLYADKILTQVIAKGSIFSLPAITTDTTFYVVGLDGILPGVPKIVPVSPIDFRFSIVPEPEELVIQEQRSALFRINLPAQAYRWYRNGILETTVAEPVLFFADTGIYEIKVWARSMESCVYQDSIEFLVTDFVEEPLSIESSAIKLFPNPATEFLEIVSAIPVRSIEIRTLDGKRISHDSKNPAQLPIAHLPAGLYLLEIELLNGEKFQKRFIKK